MTNAVHNASNMPDASLPPKFARYHRQLMVAQMDNAKQQVLADAHVAIVGMGGLGCPIALYLTGAGVGCGAGKLSFIDADTVSETNLHRQILYREADIGKPKVEVAKQTLSALNHHVHLVSHHTKIGSKNRETLLKTADVIVDAADNFAVSYLLSDYARAQKKPLVSASVVGVQGHLGVYCYDSFNSKPIPSLRAIFPSPPDAAASCDGLGVMGTSVGVIGSLQAQEVLKVIMRDHQQLAGQLLYIDLWTHRQRVMSFAHATEPLVIARIIADVDLTEDDLIVDVRCNEEVAVAPKSVRCGKLYHLGMDDTVTKLKETLATLDEPEAVGRVVFTCASGQRAVVAADNAIQAGFSNVAVWI